MGTERIMEELKAESKGDEKMYKMLVEIYRVQRANTGRWKEKYKDIIRNYAEEGDSND